MSSEQDSRRSAEDKRKAEASADRRFVEECRDSLRHTRLLSEVMDRLAEVKL